MATFVKRKLSGSTDGKGITVTSEASPGNLIHTAVSGTVAGTFDEVWLYGYNSGTAAITLTVQFGGTATPDDDIKSSLDSQSGLQLLVPGLVLQNAGSVCAYASTGTAITIQGFVNNMTD